MVVLVLHVACRCSIDDAHQIYLNRSLFWFDLDRSSLLHFIASRHETEELDSRHRSWLMYGVGGTPPYQDSGGHGIVSPPALDWTCLLA